MREFWLIGWLLSLQLWLLTTNEFLQRKHTFLDRTTFTNIFLKSVPIYVVDNIFVLILKVIYVYFKKESNRSKQGQIAFLKGLCTQRI